MPCNGNTGKDIKGKYYGAKEYGGFLLGPPIPEVLHAAKKASPKGSAKKESKRKSKKALKKYPWLADYEYSVAADDTIEIVIECGFEENDCE